MHTTDSTHHSRMAWLVRLGLAAVLASASHAFAQEPAPAPVAVPPSAAGDPAPVSQPSATSAEQADVPTAAPPLSEPAPVVVPAPSPAPDLLPPAEPVPDAPVFKADDGGFALNSGGKKPAFAIKFKLTLQIDNRKFVGDDRIRDTVLIRRIRPILDGTLLGLVDYRLMPDFAGSQAVLYDGYVDVHPLAWLRLRVGKFKSPLGLERLQGDPDLPFIERAFTANLSPTRDVGIQLWGDIAEGLVSYAVGVFNGAGDNANPDIDTGAQKDVVGRLLLAPFKAPALEKAGNLGLAIAASTGVRDGTAAATQLLPYRSVGQQNIFTYLSNAMDATGTVFAKGRHSRINPELYYYIGGFGLLSDLIWSRQHVQRGTDGENLTHRAFHISASYVIGGKNGLDGATPTSGWNPSEGQLGALEIAARYQDLRLDSDTFPTFANLSASVRRAQGFGFSLNWALTRMVRFSTGFEHSWYKGGKNGGNRNNEDVWLTRAQVNF